MLIYVSNFLLINVKDLFMKIRDIILLPVTLVVFHTSDTSAQQNCSIWKNLQRRTDAHFSSFVFSQSCG